MVASADPSRVFAGHRRLYLSLGAMAFLLFWGLPSLILPLSTDEAIYAVGARTVLRGGELYRDFWDIKPPLTYLTYVVPLGIGGADSVLALRLFNLLAIGAGMAVVFALTARFFSDRAALLAACLYCFGYFGVAWFGHQGEAESYMAAPLLLAFAAYRVRGAGVYRMALVAGLLLGIAIAYKPTAALLALGLPAMELLFRQQDWTPRAAVERLALAAVGVLAVQAAWVAYLLAVGTWADFVDIQRNYTLPYNDYRWLAGTPLWRSILDPTGGWLVNSAYLIVPAWIAVMLGLFRGKRQPTLLLGGLALLAVLSVWWQGKYFDYHWLIVLPFLAPLAGYAFDQAIDLTRSLARGDAYLARGLLAAGFIVLAIWPVLRTYDAYGLLLDRTLGNISQQTVENHYLAEYEANVQLVDQIREQGDPDDSFYVFGFWALPYFLEERPLPARFITNASVRSTWSPESWRQELIDDLERVRPRFVAVAAGDHQPWLTGTYQASDQFMCDSFPELRRFIEENYHAIMNNGLFVLYDAEATLHSAAPRCVA